MQILKKYDNTNMQIRICKYEYADSNTLTRIHRHEYAIQISKNMIIQVRKYKYDKSTGSRLTMTYKLLVIT